MTNNLPTVPQRAVALWRILKGAGPLLVAQSARLSEAYARHQLRLAEVEAIKELMIGEAKIIAEVRKKFIDKYVDAPPEDRLRLRQDIEMAEKELRQLGVYQRAIEHVPENQTVSAGATKEALDPPEELSAWLDTFNEYARKQNEPWRRELLARALALESSSPGVVGQRALWFIGTLDDRTFHAFASVLDTAIKMFEDYFIPKHSEYVGRTIPGCALGPHITLGQLLFLLGDLGLIGDLLTSEKSWAMGGLAIVSYGAHKCVAIAKQEIKIRGVLLTPFGNTIARLYEPKANDVGSEVYSSWLEGVRSSLDIMNEV